MEEYGECLTEALLFPESSLLIFYTMGIGAGRLHRFHEYGKLDDLCQIIQEKLIQELKEYSDLQHIFKNIYRNLSVLEDEIKDLVDWNIVGKDYLDSVTDKLLVPLFEKVLGYTITINQQKVDTAKNLNDNNKINKGTRNELGENIK